MYFSDTFASLVQSPGLVELAKHLTGKADQFLVLSVVAVNFPISPRCKGGGVGEAKARPWSVWDLNPSMTFGSSSGGDPSPQIHGMLPGCSDRLCASPAKASNSSGAIT